MDSTDLRTALCAIVGLLAGSVLGVVFVPDPTSVLAGVLVIIIAAIVGSGLYRSDWLREHGRSE